MSFKRYLRQLRRFFTPGAKRPFVRKYSTRPIMESLEDRIAPAGRIFPQLASASGSETITSPKLAVVLNAQAARAHHRQLC